MWKKPFNIQMKNVSFQTLEVLSNRTNHVLYIENETQALVVINGLIRSYMQPIDPCQFQWPSVTLKGGTKGVKIFWSISIIVVNSLTESDEICYGNIGRTWACFYGISHTSPFRAPASPKFLGPLTCAHTVRERAIKFCMVIKLDVRKISTVSTTNADARSSCLL